MAAVFLGRPAGRNAGKPATGRLGESLLSPEWCKADRLAIALFGRLGGQWLERYNARQQAFGARVIARARRVGAHLGAQATKPRASWTVEERHHDPVFMMHETGRRLRDIPELMELVRAYRGEPRAAGMRA